MKVVIKIWQVLSFIIFYLKKLVMANLYLAFDILTLKFYMKPAIIEIPLHLKKGYEIMILVSLVTMTPGTLVLDVSDKEHLYIHAMYLDDEGALKQEIMHLEDRIKQLFKI